MRNRIDQNKVKELTGKLQSFKDNGLSVEDAVMELHHSLSSVANQVRGVSSRSPDTIIVVHNASELGAASRAVYSSSITPLKMAILAKNIYGDGDDVVKSVLGAYHEYTATEMGKLLLDKELFPDMSKADMTAALVGGGYSIVEAQVATDAIYGADALPIEASFFHPTITENYCQVHTGPGTMFNRFYKRSWIMHYPASSYIKFEFGHPKSGFSKVNLVMVHLTSMNGPRAGSSPIDIVINGDMFKSRYNVGNGNYQKDTFDITQLVEEGANLIQLNFCSGARTNYWIQSMKVEYVK